MYNFVGDGNVFILTCEFITRKVPSSRKSTTILLLGQRLCNLFLIYMCCNTYRHTCCALAKAIIVMSCKHGHQPELCKAICGFTDFLGI